MTQTLDNREVDIFVSMLVSTVTAVGATAIALTGGGVVNRIIEAAGGISFSVTAMVISEKQRRIARQNAILDEVHHTIFEEECISSVADIMGLNQPAPQLPQSAPPPLPIPGVRNAQETMAKSLSAEPPPGVASHPQKRALWDYLSANHPEILMLLERPVLLIYGEMGSGKTTFVAFLVLLRKIFLAHRLWVADPHSADNAHLWRCGDRVTRHWDYGEIGDMIDDYFVEVQEGDKTPLTTVWDEYTNYGDRVPGGDRGFMQSALTDPRKANIFVVLVSHGDTNAALGGTKGTAEMRKRGLTRVLLRGMPTPTGKVVPMMAGTMFGLHRDNTGAPLETPFSTSEIMTPEYLENLFGAELKSVVDTKISLVKPQNSQNSQNSQNLSQSHKTQSGRESQEITKNTKTTKTTNDCSEIMVLFKVCDTHPDSERHGDLIAAIIDNYPQLKTTKTTEFLFGLKPGGSNQNWKIANDFVKHIADINYL